MDIAVRNFEAHRNTTWGTWVDLAFSNGAGLAHQFVKPPTGWTPTIVTKLDGTLSAATGDVLDDEVRKLKSYGMPLTAQTIWS